MITPTNAAFMDYVFTDFYTAFDLFSDAISDNGKINILLSMFNFSNNTSYTLFDEIIYVPPFPKDFDRYEAESKIGEGFTVPADGNSYISLVIASDFVPTASFIFTGSIEYRGVFMND